MNQISEHIGARIRQLRRGRGLTLQQLAEQIHKSRATLSKYENGEIVLDVQTLYDLAQVLGVDVSRLMDYRPQRPPEIPAVQGRIGKSPFYQASKLYFYFYDGRYERLKDGVIDISQQGSEYEASLSISSVTPTGRSSEIYYTGKVVYSDMLIRFSFVNQCNTLEEDLLYIFNPLELRDYTEGLLCGISSADLMPCAFKCLVTLTPQDPSPELKSHLLFTTQELRRWQKMNMLVVDNRG